MASLQTTFQMAVFCRSVRVVVLLFIFVTVFLGKDKKKHLAWSDSVSIYPYVNSLWLYSSGPIYDGLLHGTGYDYT